MIEVVQSGMYTTIQDFGRLGYAHLGIPFSGVMDTYSASLANQLVGNKEHESVVEITLGNTSFLVKKQCIVVISGAKTMLEVDGIEVALNQPMALEKDSVLALKHTEYGVRNYLAVQGGFDIREVFGSKSYYKNVTERFLLSKGDVLHFNKENPLKSLKNASVRIQTDHFKSKVIEVYKGPEFDWLSSEQQDLLIETDFTISKEHNRMGYRLVETIQNELASMITSAVLPGTVQLTPSGQLIVLMRDCQVTGGYPRVLQLTERSINQLAQKWTHDTFQFKLLALDS